VLVVLFLEAHSLDIAEKIFATDIVGWRSEG
jgi:hypothetical protein